MGLLVKAVALGSADSRRRGRIVKGGGMWLFRKGGAKRINDSSPPGVASLG